MILIKDTFKIFIIKNLIKFYNFTFYNFVSLTNLSILIFPLYSLIYIIIIFQYIIIINN